MMSVTTSRSSGSAGTSRKAQKSNDSHVKSMFRPEEEVQNECSPIFNSFMDTSRTFDSTPESQQSDFSSRSHTSRPPSLHPSPSMIPGSRKRRVCAPNGPHSFLPTQDAGAIGSSNDSVEGGTEERNLLHSTRITPDLKKNNARKVMMAHPTPSSPAQGAAPASPLSCWQAKAPCSPSTPEINFQNLAIRSPVVSKSPSSSFSHYRQTVFDGTPLNLNNGVGPAFESVCSSPMANRHQSPRQIPVKVISNSPSSKVAGHDMGKRMGHRAFGSPKIPMLSPRPSGGMMPPRLPLKSPVASMNANMMTSSQELPVSAFSSRVSPSPKTFHRENEREEAITMEDDKMGREETKIFAAFPRAPPTPRRIALSRKTEGTFPEYISTSSVPRSPSAFAEINMGEKMDELLRGFSSSSGKESRAKLDQFCSKEDHVAPQHLSKTSTITGNSQMKRHDSLTFSDDGSLHGRGHFNKQAPQDPPVKTVLTSKDQSRSKDRQDRRPTISQKKFATKSMFEPASSFSNENLNAMVQCYNEDTDGSLSDSDDEDCDMFFLATPTARHVNRTSNTRAASTKTMDYGTAPSSQVKTKRSKHDYTLTTASSQKNNTSTEVSQQRTCTVARERSSNSNPSFEFIFPPVKDSSHPSSQESLSESKQQHPGAGHSLPREESRSKFSSNTSLRGMDIIHENSVSNASLVGMDGSHLQPHLPRSHSGMNNNKWPSISDELSNAQNSVDSSGSGLGLRRNSSSANSLNSVGLNLEGIPLYTECSSRDMVTPPVVLRSTALSPPPIRQTKLTEDSFVGH